MLDELNEWEQANIIDAERWTFAGRNKNVLSVEYATELHRRMFVDTWRWAGRFRTSDKNIGLSWPQVSTAMHDLFENAHYWLEHDVYAIDESAVHFHCQLTRIHPFPNGNGRHARLMTDVLLVDRERPRFTWGREDLHRTGSVRQRYITALQAADGGDFEPILAFLLAGRGGNERQP